MTEAGWTREKPTVAGWYWWRSLNGMIGPEIIQIDNTNGPDTDLEVIGPFGETPLDEWIAESEDEPGEWQGPLSPDSYRQGRVAACVWKHDDTDDYYETACNRGYSLEDGTLEENDHKYCPYCGGFIQLAQQAQEGGVGDE